MATIIRLRSPYQLLQTCTETCYDATTKPCCCICKGINHGVGFEQAIINTRGLWLFPQHIAGYVEKGPDKTELYLHPKVLGKLRRFIRKTFP